MNKDDLYLSLYTVLREAGLVKTFEQVSVRFFMGIASTMTKPTTGDALIDTLKGNPDGDSPTMPDVYVEKLTSILKPEDSVRYHVIGSEFFTIHYVIILNGDLGGRVKGFEDCHEALTLMRTVDTVDGDKIEALMLIGNGSENVTDKTRGPIIKHELTHVLLKYFTEIKIPDFGNMIKDLTDEEWKDFVEFLCDFIQFDSSIINRYTPNPISKFGDALEFIFKPGTAEKYAPYMKAISGYFDTVS